MLVDEWKLPFLQVFVDVDVGIDGFRLRWTNKRLEQTSNGNGYPDKDLSWRLNISGESISCRWSRNRHFQACCELKKKISFRLLLFLWLVFGRFIALSIRNAHSRQFFTYFALIDTNFLQRRDWLTIVRLLVNGIKILSLLGKTSRSCKFKRFFKCFYYDNNLAWIQD